MHASSCHSGWTGGTRCWLWFNCPSHLPKANSLHALVQGGKQGVSWLGAVQRRPPTHPRAAAALLSVVSRQESVLLIQPSAALDCGDCVREEAPATPGGPPRLLVPPALRDDLLLPLLEPYRKVGEGAGALVSRPALLLSLAAFPLPPLSKCVKSAFRLPQPSAVQHLWVHPAASACLSSFSHHRYAPCNFL